ncbi:DUF3800 domain-containing protein [Pseudonocardia sp. H11422]|uniref:DUF3800 domain-containing protein n=1 Tax=Pseudonocardia sp. H11422 TaxID=2835866 RepID=UPI0027E3B15C|nr:DUF3800 domain-containing protein [Pseudonocardia sp. H11422]
MPEPLAYIDESFHEHDAEGFYVLAAAVLAQEADEIGALLQGLAAHRSPGKLHWTESSARYRQAAVERIAGLDALHVIVVGAPVAARKQERARAICLRRLAFELNGLGVTQLVVESRQQVLDQRDVRTIQQARFDLPKGTLLRVEHHRGATDPRLWVADIVAGAVRAHHLGNSTYRDQLGALLHLVEVPTAD